MITSIIRKGLEHSSMMKKNIEMCVLYFDDRNAGTNSEKTLEENVTHVELK